MRDTDHSSVSMASEIRRSFHVISAQRGDEDLEKEMSVSERREWDEEQKVL